MGKMTGKLKDVKISVAFRFHVNMYHSYRGDTPDEYGIGKDIRLIKYILDILDKYNRKGVPVKGTWDIENYFSLENNMRKHCPELIERIKKRVEQNYDEIEIMSYNNGLVSADMEEDFRENMRRAISNEGGSGVKDVFKHYAPVVRPQECMMTPGLIKLYQQAGIEAFSVFYSCIPFNGFSNFIPLLPVEKRYNPLWYTAPGVTDKIIVLPAINPGDVYDNFGLVHLIKSLRREQRKMKSPCDLLVLLDMDADDDFWQGYLNTTFSFGLGLQEPLLDGGLNIFIRQLNKLPYVKFDTPYAYLQNHPPVGEVSVGQDLADGSFDGYSPWSDKLENTKLWTGIDRSRMISEYALEVADYADEIKTEVEQTRKQRLLATSTTHFGLSTPVMCKPRLQQAMERAGKNLAQSEHILSSALQQNRVQEDTGVKAVFPSRFYRGEGRKKGLIRLASNNESALLTGKGVKTIFNREIFGRKEINLVFEGRERKIHLNEGNNEGNAEEDSSVYISSSVIGNSHLELRINTYNELVLYYNGQEVTDKGSFTTSVNYQNRLVSAGEVEYEVSGVEGKVATITEKGKLHLSDKMLKMVSYEKKYMIAGDLPYLFVDVDISYPLTADYGTDKAKVKKLYRGYDTRWREVMPLEIVPSFRGSKESPIRVHKHNFLGDLTYFDFNYEQFSDNKEIDASNNAITCGFVSFSANNRGILLAQSVAADNNFAFSRARLRKEKGMDKLFINPFGVYTGKQLKYNTERLGLAQKVALKFAESYMSCAPSFRGGRQQFSLMIAPFDGIKPSEELINSAIMHAYPPYIQSTDERYGMINFTDWKNFEPLDFSY